MSFQDEVLDNTGMVHPVEVSGGAHDTITLQSTLDLYTMHMSGTHETTRKFLLNMVLYYGNILPAAIAIAA